VQSIADKDTMDDRTKERIRKLLALAANNPSIEEAATAFARAQEIAMMHGLDLDDLASETPTDAPVEPPRTVESITRREIDTWKRRVSWRVTIGNAVARANHCDVFYTSIGLYAYGQPSDLETVAYIYAAITSEVEIMANAAVKAYREDPDADPRWDESPRTYGRSWRLGCADAIAQRMPRPDAMLAKARAALPSDRTTALVRIDNATEFLARVKTKRDCFAQKLDLTTGTPTVGARSFTGYSAGRTAGSSMALASSGRALKGRP
jgi:hypothetical protein